MTAESLARQMRAAAAALLDELDGEQRALAALPFSDEQSRRWLEYRPQRRPGACLAGVGPAGRKAAHRLLATGLSEPAYAQAMAIVSLEEVLDRREGWLRGRHSGDYWVSVFGNPAADELWAWRFEGHHLSVTMTISSQNISPAPVFLGANPHRVAHAGRVVSRPLAPEEDVARALLDALGSGGRARAVVADAAPDDIRSATRPRVQAGLGPPGIAAGELGPGARALLTELVAVYLGRLPEPLASAQAARVAGDETLAFAWEGPLHPGARHYYRIQADDLLIEYDNTTDDGNHAHTVLRRPRSDFGDDVLAAHYAAGHAPAG
ncbi:MAG TPA: DUF3500 domain-containing protein [Streptosporangiaceae bacterium]